MTINVNVDLGYEFEVKAGIQEVFDVLSHIPTAATFYPKVDKLVDLGNDTYRWEFEKIGIAQFYLQTIFACKYASNRAKGTINWTPVKGEGNGLIEGGWKLTDKKKSTKIVLAITGELTLPVPGLLKMVITPLVKSEFEKMTDQWVENLSKRFGGEV